MSTQPAFDATDRGRHGGCVATVRVSANALLVLSAYEFAIAVVGVARGIITRAPAGPVESWLLFPLFLVVRWVHALPGMLLVLIAFECVARGAPHARVLTTVVAFGPMAWWQLTPSSGDTPGIRRPSV